MTARKPAAKKVASKSQAKRIAVQSAPVEPAPVVLGIKGFRADWTCAPQGTPFQFVVGQTYTHAGDVRACASGFHFIEGHPLEVFDYYAPADSVYATVEGSGKLARHDGDSKVAAEVLTVKAKLDIAGLCKATFEWVRSKASPTDQQHATGDRSASSATGDQSASSATGDRSASSATGDRSASSATGYQSASSATGDRSASSATGYRSASSATGDQSASSATGDRSASSATGYQSASSATGYQSASSATGDQSASLATGYLASAEVRDGERPAQGVAIATGEQGKARAPKGSAIVCVYRDDDGNLIHIRASKVGENGIQPDVFYALNASGEFVAVRP